MKDILRVFGVSGLSMFGLCWFMEIVRLSATASDEDFKIIGLSLLGVGAFFIIIFVILLIIYRKKL